jgi:hypothetical protein
MTALALAAALALGETGLPSFPCTYEKSPACPDGFKAASSDPARLRSLWRDYDGSLVGVPTGAVSGIDVLDLDAKHAAAREWWMQHRERLLPTRAHRTRHHGIHLVYRHRPDLRCTVSAIASGVDTRADGGYIIWWPAAGLPILSPAPVADWPKWFALPALSAPSLTPPRPAVTERPIAVGYGAAALERAYGRILGAVAGEQERTLTFESLSIGSLVAGGELDLGAVRAALHDAGRRLRSYYADQPWRPGEAERKVDRALARGLAAPRRRPRTIYL